MATGLLPFDYIRFRTFQYCVGETQIAVNTSYWRVEAITGTPTIESAVPIFGAAIAPLYTPLMSSLAAYAGTGACIMEGPPVVKAETSEIYSTTGAAVGETGTNQTPGQTSFVIALKSGFASKHDNGRIYPGFPSIDWTTGSGLMTTAAKVALDDLATYYTDQQLLVIGGGTSLTIKCQIRAIKVVAGVKEASYTPVSVALARGRFGTQRRRGQMGRINVLPF